MIHKNYSQKWFTKMNYKNGSQKWFTKMNYKNGLQKWLTKIIHKNILQHGSQNDSHGGNAKNDTQKYDS